jgi:hypothetical protein
MLLSLSEAFERVGILVKRPKLEREGTPSRTTDKAGCARSVAHRRQGGLVLVSASRIPAYAFVHRARIPNPPRPPGFRATSGKPNRQEFNMHALRTLMALSVATLATACASPGTTTAAPPANGMTAMAMGGAGSTAAMDSRMKAMQEMHQKMMNAGTPAERQALMADHMKAMQGGMAMMKEMQAMHAGSGAGGMGMMGSPGGAAPMAGMGDGKAMPADMAKRHQMMTDHMAMMQTMMDMMADRMPPASPAK